MLTILKILAAVLVFGLIIFIHEFGHFITARMVGIKVEEFSLGMGPRLFTIHGKKTDYSLKLLPIGGSCAFIEDVEGESTSPEAFNNNAPWKRFLVVLAGPAFNFILAMITAVILIASLGTDTTTIHSVIDGYPAQEAGICAGDEILSLNNRRVHLYREIQLQTMLYPGRELDVKVRRGDEIRSFHIIPKYHEEDDRYLIGITSEGTNIMPTGFFELIRYSFYEVRYNFLMVVDSLVWLFSGNFTRDAISGPVGIVSVISDTVEETYAYGWRILLLTITDFLLLFSTNLGVMNLLPFPALDGGRLWFILIEWITGKHLDRKAENAIHLAGFAILLVLMVLIMVNDVTKLF